MKSDEPFRNEFLAALNRLRDAKPTHPALIGRRIRISVRSVALEAGHSRSHLYREGYEEILDEIRLARPGSVTKSKHRSRDETVARLRDELQQVKAAMSALATENLTLFHRAIQAERRVLRLKEKLDGNISDLRRRSN